MSHLALDQRQDGRAGVSRPLRLIGAAAVCVIIAESIGPATIPLGGRFQIVLSPFLWALFIGVLWGASSFRLPRAVRVDEPVQAMAAAALQPALLMFIAKLGLLVGGTLPKIFQSGWALVLQEFGHFFGTMVLGLPIALLLGVKREAIGATFSVGREPSLAIIGEKFGMGSPEGHGVLAEYLTGTVFGTVFVALLAALVTSLGIFHPHALAMGAGVGSGSVMAAAAASIAAQQTPEMAKEVAAFAAASNLITTTVGTYFSLFLSLPFTIRAYGALEPRIGRTRWSGLEVATAAPTEAEAREPQVAMTGAQVFAVWLITGAVVLLAGAIAARTAPTIEAVAAMALVLVPVVIGYVIWRVTRGMLPAVLWVSLIAMALTYPDMPHAAEMAAYTGKVNFLALATPIIALAGLSVARNLPIFRRLGWRIVVVSLCANAGTFLGATIIAQIFGIR